MFSDQCAWSVALARSVCQVVIIFARVRSHTKEALKGIVSCGGSLGDGVERVQLAAMKYVRMIKVPEVVVLARPCDSFSARRLFSLFRFMFWYKRTYCIIVAVGYCQCALETFTRRSR